MFMTGVLCTVCGARVYFKLMDRFTDLLIQTYKKSKKSAIWNSWFIYLHERYFQSVCEDNNKSNFDTIFKEES